MSNSIGEILGELLSGKESAENLGNALGKALEKSQNNETDASSSLSSEPNLNEKQLMLQRKIDILLALKPLLGEEFSKKTDMIINALTAAKIIAGFKNEKQ